MATLSDILKSANSYLDLEYALPTGTELTTRVNLANQAINDACSAYRYREFNEFYYPSTSTLASVSMPANFRELIEAPAVANNGSYLDYQQIRSEEVYTKSSSDRYCYLLGTVGNYTLVFNNLTANATVSLQYQRYPSGMATLTDICELPDAEYVKTKLISYVLQSRSDERFPTVEADANNRLKNMIGRSTLQPTGGLKQIPRSQSYAIGK